MKSPATLTWVACLARISFSARMVWSCLFLLLLISINTRAQFCLGVGPGSENLHLGITGRSWMPHINVEYITPEMRGSYYLNATAIQHHANFENSFINSQGESVPYKQQDTYTQLLLHLGVKGLIGGDADKVTPLLFIGFGFADCISFNHYVAKGTDPSHPMNSNIRQINNSFGLGFNAGIQYYLKSVILQFGGDLDFLVKPVSEYGSDSHVHTDTRLTVLIPLRHL